jgi:hypothetical protein
MGEMSPHGDVLFARAARTALRGRRAWVYASPTAHARLQETGTCGPVGEADDPGAPLLAAGMAVNDDGPVVVPLGAETFVAVPVPFADGRPGAIVVSGGPGLAGRALAAEHLSRVAARLAAYAADGNAQVPGVRRVGAG